MKRSTYEAAKQLCRELRKRQTLAEADVWKRLRNRQFLGKKFLRQHPIFFTYEGDESFFIADFYSRELKLVIELDGKHHELQKDYDSFRTHIINDLGLLVIRFRNEEIDGNVNHVLGQLKSIILSQAEQNSNSPSLLIEKGPGDESAA
ncbi:MAG: DUF559 domain-containing protein [Ignavibacteriales bacterium]|nr:DUF559 domain-containing protein [Ignavibacteriales bacterium]